MRVADASYQVSKQLREIVTFARQNLISDLPMRDNLARRKMMKRRWSKTKTTIIQKRKRTTEGKK